MHDDDAIDAAREVHDFAARLGKDPHLAAELQRARREFFPSGAAGAATLPGAADAAELRFAEWFTLERESEVLGAVPVDVPAWCGGAADLADSTAGLWLVQAVGARSVQANDLQDGTSLDLAVPVDALQPGDLVVGRLFAEGAGRWTPSTAAAIFRPGGELAQALVRDLRRLGLDRRLHQVELEHLLLRRPQTAGGAGVQPPRAPTRPLEHLEADLETLLHGADAHTAPSISQQLAVAVRPGPVIGPLLDELAFETDVDLDRIREVLLAIWNAHHADDEPEPGPVLAEPSAPPAESLGERLVRTLDEGLAQKRDVAELFAQLERMAGIEPEPEPELGGVIDDDDDGEVGGFGAAGGAAADDDAEDSDAADSDAEDDDAQDDDAEDSDAATSADAAPMRPRSVEPIGNVGPLVEEYLWESDRTQDAAAAPLRLFAELQQNAALPHDLEDTTAVDVMRLLLHVYLGAAPADRAGRVRAAFDELRGFCQWANDVQEMDLAGVLERAHGALLEQLDRLQAAGEALTTATAGGSRPGILEVEDVGPQGFGVVDDDGGNHWLAAPPHALAHLRVGDLVLGALGPAAAANRRTLAGLVVVLPADAKSLME